MSNYLDSTANQVFIPEIVANRVLGALGAYLNLGKTVTKDGELTTAQFGQVINVPKRGVVSSNDKAENTDVTVQKPAATDVQVTLDNHKEVTIGEEDFTRSLQPGSVLPGYTEDGVIALGEDIEEALANLASSIPYERDGAGTPIDFSDLINVRRDLVMRKVPKLATKYGYVHPTDMAYLLKENPVLDPKVDAGFRALTEGALTRLAGFDLFEGQLVKEEGSSSPPVRKNMFYTRNAFVLATRPLPMPDARLGVQAATVQDENGISLRVLRSYDAKGLAVIITIDVLFGVAVLDERQAQILNTV